MCLSQVSLLDPLASNTMYMYILTAALASNTIDCCASYIHVLTVALARNDNVLTLFGLSLLLSAGSR